MTGAELPTTIIGLASLVAVIVGGLIHLRLQQRTTSRQISEVHEQVRNDHPGSPNLRDDLDDMRDMLRDMQDRSIAHGQDLAGIRGWIKTVDRKVDRVDHKIDTETERSITKDDHIHTELRDDRERTIIAINELRTGINACREGHTK